MEHKPFPSDAFDYSSKVDPSELELRTVPKVRSLNKVAITGLSILAIVLITIVFAYGMHKRFSDREQAVKSTVDTTSNDKGFYTEIPSDYSKAASYEREQMERLINSEKKPPATMQANMGLSMDLLPHENNVPGKLIDVCKIMIARHEGNPEDITRCKVLLEKFNLDGQQVSGTVPVSDRLAQKSQDDCTVNDNCRRSSSGKGSAKTNPLDEGQEKANVYSEEDIKAMDSPLVAHGEDFTIRPSASNSGASGPGSDSSDQMLALASAMNNANGAFNPPNAQGQSTQDPIGQNLQDEKRKFIEDKKKEDAVYLNEPLIKPRSPYELMAGTNIPIVLSQGINSDLPGTIKAMVTQNVYDTVTGQYLLVPQGTTVVGAYDSVISYGQERVLVVWTRLIRPDGSSISLEGMQGVDMSGYAGMTGHIDNHYTKLLSAVVLSSMLSVTSNANNNNSTTLTDRLAASLGNGVNQAGQQIVQRNLNVQPTIIVRPGDSAYIVVNKDIVLAEYDE